MTYTLWDFTQKLFQPWRNMPLVDPGTQEVYDGTIEYSMMLIQKFSELQEASDKLHKAGYYDNWPKEYYNEVVKSRYKTYNKVRRSL